MVRATMQALVDSLRGMTDAARTDQFNDIVYWTDDQLQDILDGSRIGQPYRIDLTASEYKLNGETQWWIQSATFPDYWGIEDGFPVYDSNGVAVSSNDFTWARYGRNLVVTLDNSVVAQGSYVAELTLYDMYVAAAEVWGRKAAQRRSLVEVRSGVHQIKAQQEVEHCERREKFFRTRTAKVFDLPNKRRFVPAAQRG